MFPSGKYKSGVYLDVPGVRDTSDEGQSGNRWESR